mgnify:CR=1 FL=1
MNSKTITLSKIIYSEVELLVIGFSYDFDTKEYIKNFDGVLWHKTLKSYCLPFSKHITNTLFKYLRAKNYFVDYSSLKDNTSVIPINTASKTKILGTPSPSILERIVIFKKWMTQKRYSDSTIKTYESMLLKLFYTYDGLDPLLSDNLERPKKQSKLPEVLSIDEVKSILNSISNLKHKTLLSFLYACGLRIGETLNIKLNDLDLERGFTHIKSGKGSKDRYVPIPRKMCELLSRYIEAYKPSPFLFQGATSAKYSPVSARQVLKRAIFNTKIKKPITLHTLRHSHATHLLENGTDIRYIQELLGHNSPKTTMIYTHVSTASLDKIKNPFNDFDI